MKHNVLWNHNVSFGALLHCIAHLLCIQKQLACANTMKKAITTLPHTRTAETYASAEGILNASFRSLCSRPQPIECTYS